MTAADPRRGPGPRVGVLLAAAASPWEPAALEALAAGGRVALVKRCLDLPDLLATAATGTAEVAVVSAELPGLDGDSIDRLAREGVRVLVVSAPAAGPRREADGTPSSGERLLRMGAARAVGEDDVAALAQLVEDTYAAADAAAPAPDRAGSGSGTDHGVTHAAHGRLLAVWGPTGAPGRTTVAVGLAAEAAAAGLSVTLLDADPYGGAVGQHLAVLDEVSGLLAAVRLANAGQLDAARLAGLAREVYPGLRILTGLPRPDRWTEVRPQALGEVLAAARAVDGLVVVDTGFGLPGSALDPFATGADRDAITSAVLEEADQVVVVGSADPVGLTRLARSLRDLLEIRPERPQVVAVNRMRNSLGWSTREIADLVAQVTPGADVVFLPEDRVAVDRALVAGRTLVESGDSPLRRALTELARRVLPVQVGQTVSRR